MSTVKEMPQEFAELEILVERAETHRDAHTITQLRRFAEHHPTLFQAVSHFTSDVQNRLINYIASGDINQKAQLKRNIEELRTHLVGNRQPQALDQLMCTEVTTAFLLMKFMDTLLARHFHEVNTLDIRKADYASIRFSRAVKTLHKLRSVLPDINFNQVNITSQESSIQQECFYQDLEDTIYHKS